MSGERVERRLVAIMAADVAGYSRLMGEDEEGTLAALRAVRRELVDAKIAEHRGRIVKTTGDGLLVEFASIVDAVRCGVEVQREMAARNAAIPAGRRIEFRMGINVGDVIIEGGDIFGDGVNIAARLEALAEPGGIRVSRVVRDQVRDKLGVAFEDGGEQHVKNIARPLRIYRVAPETLPALSATAAVAPLAAGTPRLSIVVLPFANLSNDPEQEYFADGITEDLTTDLSRIEGMLVISRNTAFTYRGKPVDTKQIGRELGVRYLLEGSVRRSGNQVRVTAQLIDAETDVHLWADRFTGDTADLFVLQDEITRRIAVALNLELVFAEASRPEHSPDARDSIFRGRAALYSPPSGENYGEAIALFERALTLDPQSAEAQSWLAAVLVNRWLDFRHLSTADDIARAEGLATGAVAALPRSPLAHYARGEVRRVQARYTEAIAEYETVLGLNRNWVYAFANIGRCKVFIGPVDEAISAQQQAIRLSPRDPKISIWYYRIGQAHLIQSRIDEAIFWLEKACSANPEPPFFHAYLAAARALKGEIESAAAELAEARRRGPRYSSIAAIKSSGADFGVPEVRALFEATYFAGLRKAGVPEE